MPKFYYTYGTNNYPFRGGWSEIIAPDMKTADEIFKIIHPHPTEPLLLHCAFVYTEEHFKKTGMLENGNYGAFCQETITLKISNHTAKAKLTGLAEVINDITTEPKPCDEDLDYDDDYIDLYDTIYYLADVLKNIGYNIE